MFVSSTFVDFKEEREILIKKAFREVNRICLDRGVFFTYVDLRWGITSDQSKDGKTISICLREVRGFKIENLTIFLIVLANNVFLYLSRSPDYRKANIYIIFLYLSRSPK